MATASSSTQTHTHNGDVNSVLDHFPLIFPCCLYLPSAQQNWFWVMTFLCLIGWFSHNSISDTIPKWVPFHSSCRKMDRKVENLNPNRLTSESQRNQNHLEWSSGLLLHLWCPLQNCDPELVYMFSPETHICTQRQKDKAVSNFIYISYYFLIYGQFTDYITNRVCAVHLDRDVGHVDPLMSRMKETGDFFLCISIQLLQGRADTYIIIKVTVGCCDSCGQNQSCRPCPTELGLSKHELCHIWLIFNFR